MSGPPRQRSWPGKDEPGRRLFIAAPLPAEAVTRVAELVDRVRAPGVPGGGRDARWVRMDGLHVTLRFLGPTLEDRVPSAREALRNAVVGAGFEVELEGAGAFPSPSRPRTLWMGIRDGAADLAALAGRIDEALVGAGWPPSDRDFRPHLTLARSDGIWAGAELAQRLIAEASGIHLRFRVDAVGLFESLTGGGPARYEPMEMIPLD
jgi:RNA 2',3'-cyclic 3'-phosphodiesterase